MKHFSSLRVPIIKGSFAVAVLMTMLLTGPPVQAQIYEPEGVNMPGAWDSWANPPSNLALASSTQATGGRIARIAAGTPYYHTWFSVKATGGDLTGGTYEWLFTSGPSTNYFQNKWSAVNVVMDTLMTYTKEGATNNSVTLVNDKWYTVNFEDLGYVNTRAIFMETSAEPVQISSVSVPSGVTAGDPAIVTVTVSAAPCLEEYVYLRYSTDGWTTSGLVTVIFTGTTGSATIPGQPAGTTVSYYAFSSTLTGITADHDLATIHFNNNSGANYSYTVATPPPAITFANLQGPDQGQIIPREDFEVFGQAYIPGITGQSVPAAGLQAWVGWNSVDTDPATWTDWIPATYNAPAGNNDEFKANLGNAVEWPGTYYYATRFRLNADPYVYGGFSATGGGFWDGITNLSGVLDVLVGMPEKDENGVRVYPNPAPGEVTIESPAPCHVTLLTPDGRTLATYPLKGSANRISLDGIEKGIYLLRFSDISGGFMRKLVVSGK